MTTGADIDCFRCGSEFEPKGSDGTDLLYECQECGMSLTERGTRELAEMDGAMARLAEVLLEKAGGNQ